MPARENLQRIRRIAHGFDLPEDRDWLAAALKRYLLAADDGLTLEDAFELKSSSSVPWWRLSAMEMRDASLRELARLFCPSPSLAQRAEMVSAMLDRYAASGWPSDRLSDTLPAAFRGTAREIMFHILKQSDKPISVRQLRRILAR